MSNEKTFEHTKGHTKRITGITVAGVGRFSIGDEVTLEGARLDHIHGGNAPPASGGPTAARKRIKAALDRLKEANPNRPAPPSTMPPPLPGEPVPIRDDWISLSQPSEEGRNDARSAPPPDVNLDHTTIREDAEDGIGCIDAKDYGGARRALEDIKDKATDEGV